MQRNRIENKDVSLPERRMDSLARVLDFRGKCVAVSIVDGKLYVASNEIDRTRGIESKKDIKKIIEYFQKCANKSEITSEYREETFLLINSKDRFGSVKRGMYIPDGLSQIVVKQILSGDYSSTEELRRKHGAVYDYVLGEITWIYRQFLKLEQSIREEELTLEQMAALRSEPVVLETETIEGVHAEVKILGHLVSSIATMAPVGTQEASKNIYIGISKLCCLGCRTMIESANELLDCEASRDKPYAEQLKDKPLMKIKTRGQHDLDFDNWECPSTFRAGYDYSATKSVRARSKKAVQETLEFAIGALSKERFDQLKVNTKLTNVRQESEASISDPDDSSKAIAEKLRTLKQHLVLLESMASHNMEDVIKATAVAIKLHQMSVFIEFYDVIPKTKNVQQMQQKFTDILQSFNRENPGQEVTPEFILIVLKNQELVGKKMSVYFESLKMKSGVKRDRTTLAESSERLDHPSGEESLRAGLFMSGGPYHAHHHGDDKGEVSHSDVQPKTSPAPPMNIPLILTSTPPDTDELAVPIEEGTARKKRGALPMSGKK
ncbi:MAG: hypothetical protein KA508_00470 [Gammaproteobacteria bacterium]|nr:hypothetical protein [Gammaproteobacteria bacterium]